MTLVMSISCACLIKDACGKRKNKGAPEARPLFLCFFVSLCETLLLSRVHAHLVGVLAELEAGDGAVVDFVGAVGEAQRALAGVEAG